MDRIFRIITLGLTVFFSVTASAQMLTVQIGSPPAPPAVLVRHSEVWSFHKGTNAPQANWQTVGDGTLNADWGSAAGGFGYGDNAITNVPGTSYESTMLPDMLNGYTTLFIRRTFTVGSQVDTNLHLLLSMDYDDGFVAYLDGAEIRRANTTNAVGAAVTFSQTTGANSHEASCCTSPNPATTYDLGTVSNRLAVGTHVLAIVGLNQSATSTDFHLIADLSLSSGSGGSVANNGLYSLASTNVVFLTGTNTVAGSTRVTVNGDDSVINPAQGTWTNSVPLAPGFNRLFIAALDNAGNLLSNLTQDIVYEPVALSLNGALAGNTSWTNTNEVVHITGTVTVPAGASLTIGPGVVVIVSPGASVLAGAGAAIDVQGLDTREVYFLPATSNVWNEVAADGANSTLTIRYADVSRGAVKFRNGATGLLEDSFLHEYKNGTVPIAGCTSAAEVTVRRSHFNVYHETLWQLTRMTVEASLFENANNTNSDALDFDTAPSGSVIRRSTFRFGPQPNTDAIDIGSGCIATLIEGCLMHDFPFDKGVSIGETSYAITIRNCLMYRNDSGVAVKDNCTAIIEGCTVASNDFGFRNYNKANPSSPTGGGYITNSSNNILWGNVVSISLSNASTVVASYSDFAGTNWPGTGNISVDPLFVNAAAGDYRLQAGSPALGAGAGGTNLGVTLPVGGIPMWVSNLAAVGSGANDVMLSWVETADNEAGFRVERSTDKVGWQIIGGTPANATSFADTTGPAGAKYYYRVRATNDVGVSPLSNVASGQRQAIAVITGGNVGGTISQDTSWAGGGTFTVTSSVTVANGATLYIMPGATVQFNSGLNLTVANGGILLAEGASNAPVLFTRNGSGTWGHLVVNGTAGSPETRISNARFEFNNTSPCILVSGGTVFLDHLTFGNAAQAYLHLDDASFIVQNCEFPTATAAFEPVHGTGGIKSGGHGLFIRNFFGAANGYNDVVDFTGGSRPSPIIEFLDNVFTGSGDDELDLDGTDAWVEGNIFLHAHKNGSPDTASGVSGGDDTGSTSEITVVGNIFYDLDHAAMAKGGNFYTFLNNTVVHQTKTGGTDTDGSVFCLADAGYAQAAGMFIEGNIIYDAEKLTRFYTNSAVTMSNNLMPFAWAGAGGNNSTVDPLLTYLPLFSETAFTNWASAQIMKQWFKPLSNSPAVGTGPNGRDRGGVVPIGASISGEPASQASSSNATLVVGFNRGGSGIPTAGWPLGSGYLGYKYRVDGGTWSGPQAIGLPVVLTNLATGAHYVEVAGQRDTGTYQDDVANGPAVIVTRSKTWFVGSVDTDNDRIPDDWEDAHGLNKLINDAAFDPDGDGMTNLEEYLAGTDPQSFGSRLWLHSLATAGENFSFSFLAVSNKSYTVQNRPSLSTGVWERLQDFIASPTNRTLSVTNPPGASRFYQVVTPIMP